MVGVVRVSLVACLAAATACSAPVTSPARTPSPTAPPQPDPLPAQWFGEASRPIPVFADPAEPATFAEIAPGESVYVIRSEAEWLRIEFQLVRRAGPEDVFGWIPAELDGTATLRPGALACPEDPSVAGIASMSAPERLRCFGAADIELEGWAIGEPIADFIFGGEPAWLATPSRHLLSSIDPLIGGPAFRVHLGPELADEWPIGSEVMVRGHFDDARSADCRRTGPAAASPETPEESVLWCRQRFVVTEVAMLADG